MGSNPETLLQALEQLAHQETCGYTVYTPRGASSLLSFATVYRRSRQVGAALRALGIRPGERLGLAIHHPGEFLVHFFGIQWAGAIPVPMASPQGLSGAASFVELAEHILIMTGARSIIVGDNLSTILSKFPAMTGFTFYEPSHLLGEGHLPPSLVSGDDLALIQCTSGSTSRPRGIRLSHSCLLANIQASTRQATPLTPEDVVVSWLPLYHDLGLISGVLGPMVRGIPSVLMTPLHFMTDPHQWLHLLSRHQGTVSWAPNQAYRYAASSIIESDLEGIDLRRWRVAGCAAEPIRPHVLQTFTQRFSRYGFRDSAWVTAYGLAEFSLGASFSPPGRGLRIDRIEGGPFRRGGLAIPAQGGESLEFTGCGFPLAGHDIEVVDGAGQPLPERRVGQIRLRGPSQSVGYEGGSGEDSIPGDGWLYTGDRGYLAEGELFVCGRMADLLVQAEETLGAEDVEGILAAALGDSVGVLTSFQDESGGIVVLVEMPGRPDTTVMDSVRTKVDAGITRAGVPISVLTLVPAGVLPRTTSGKIRRGRARFLHQEGQIKALATWRTCVTVPNST